MITQTEEFAFCADHITGYRRCDNRHGHTFLLKVTTSFSGDHAIIRGTVARAVCSKLHMSYLNDIEGLDRGCGGTVEAILAWVWAQLEETPIVPVRVEVTELSASPTFELVPHSKALGLPS